MLTLASAGMGLRSARPPSAPEGLQGPGNCRRYVRYVATELENVGGHPPHELDHRAEGRATVTGELEHRRGGEREQALSGGPGANAGPRAGDYARHHQRLDRHLVLEQFGTAAGDVDDELVLAVLVQTLDVVRVSGDESESLRPELRVAEQRVRHGPPHGRERYVVVARETEAGLEAGKRRCRLAGAALAAEQHPSVACRHARGVNQVQRRAAEGPVQRRTQWLCQLCPRQPVSALHPEDRRAGGHVAHRKRMEAKARGRDVAVVDGADASAVEASDLTSPAYVPRIPGEERHRDA